MIYLHESYMAELGFQLATPGSAVRCATNSRVDRKTVASQMVIFPNT